MTFIRSAALIFILAFVCAQIQGLFLKKPTPSAEDLEGQLSYQQAVNFENALWIDGRALSLYEEDHVEGAIHLSLEDWESGFFQLLNLWDGEQPILVYCDGAQCKTSKEISDRLKQNLETENVYWIKDGWNAIQAEGPKE